MTRAPPPSEGFNMITRFEAASVQYLSISPTNRLTSLKQQKTPTDISSLKRVPSESTCNQKKDLCWKGCHVAVSYELGVFTVESLNVLLKIQSLHDVQSDVMKEQKWLKKDVRGPDVTCLYSKEDLVAFADKIFNAPENCGALGGHSNILACDLATLEGTGWINFSIMSGLPDILNKERQDTKALILNSVILVKENDLPVYANCNVKCGVKYVFLFANVGKTKNNEVFIRKPGYPGNHWTFLYVDVTINKWYYCDTSCWGMPNYLQTEVTPFLKAIYL